MKTRDKLKYGFAGLLAVMTVIAIGGLLLARHHRQQVSLQEEMQVKQAISIYGEDGALPKKLEMPDDKPATGLLPK
jgi:hypothetical protein